MLSERILDKLLSCNISFLGKLTSDQLDALANEVRVSPYRNNILFNSFKDIVNEYPVFAFKITYDIEYYQAYWIRLLRNNYSILLDYQFLLYFLLSGEWVVNFVYEELNYIVSDNKDCLFAIIRYSKRTNDYRLTNKLKDSPNMKIRAMFIIEVLDSFPELFNFLFDDVIECFVKYNEKGIEVEKMKECYVSKIASLILMHTTNEELYLKIRDFILNNYSSNSLAAELDRYGKLIESVNPLNLFYLISDIDILFKTSKNYKYVLFTKYGKYLNKVIYDEFYSKIRPFIEIDEKMIENIFINSLGDKFLEYVSKYLALSTGSRVVCDAGRGSCTRTFRIGDYVIKCSDKKWSFEENICPNGYLILKNLEEDIVRNNKGEVTGAIEVQKYLSRPLLASEVQDIINFQQAFMRSGYYIKDRLIDDEFGANCRHLEDYRDADCDNPELLPDWFKRNPIVLVDRDLVYSLNNTNPKIKAVNI
ncbi:MAG: hypothetical protein ACI4XM_06530 [Candidatus Coprovivens sp.]